MNTLNRPVLVYDGDCDFCRHWIARWRYVIRDRVDFLTSQEAGRRFPDISPEQYQSSIKLIQADGAVFDGAQAVFRALALHPRHRWPLWLYRKVWGVAPVTESAYRFVARHREFFSRWTQRLWGDPVEPSTYYLSRKVFLVALGIIYLLAFLSLTVQIQGLIGSQGVMPVKDFLEAARQVTGWERYWVLPTVFWLHAGDTFLNVLCFAGMLLSLFVIAGVFVVPSLFLLWLFYLSLVTAGQEFMAFQWDVLLLEAGFLAIFFAAWGLRPKPGEESAPSPVLLFLYRFLLFRVMFSSGMVKLTSGDASWLNGTALNFHYETQPLPTWGGWYAHQLPGWFQEISLVLVFLIQLAVPFLIFFPRRLRHLACAVLVSFQLLIVATGNYAFFNLLTIALCLLLLDDTVWQRWLPQGVARPRQVEEGAKIQKGRAKKWIVGTVAAAILFVSVTQHLMPMIFKGSSFSASSLSINQWIRHWHVVNAYGLFAVMTTRRPEIILEGSLDGKFWKAYEFRWKPGNIKRAPEFVAPHQPRLDWQMWFAALGNFQQNRWILNLMARLLQGAAPVHQLLAKDPFDGSPPKYIRAVVYEYRFTDFSGWRVDGSWWRREFKGLYAPVLQLPEKA